MAYVDLKVVSSLEKVFLDEEPQENSFQVQGFQNEVISFQVAYSLKESPVSRVYVTLEVESPIKDHVFVRQVEHMPVRYAAPIDSDDNYLRKTPGLYPDLLREIGAHTLRARVGQWDTLWVDVKPLQAKALPVGKYPVTIKLTAEGEETNEITLFVNVLEGMLPEQKLIHTKWLHCDCIAEYYQCEVFSEKHWEIVEKYIRAAVDGGINMILTPIHTPPLDTRVGGERLTNQLVEVSYTNGKYAFDTQKLHRWIQMCKNCGVQYYEMSHLFTQWGARHAPKIMANVNGEYVRLFGWETDATGPEYREFLKAYIPAVREVLKEEGIDDRTYWHVSDEPNAAQLQDYKAAKEQVKHLLEGCVIMDALSSYDFYQHGVVENPVVANNHIQKFIDEGVQDLWAYYCCGQYIDVSNMFVAMPSARNRILGAQLFKYQIRGFLQWGFNFYKSQYSDHCIDPYFSLDGDGFVPAGDTFQVYPGENGQPLESIRMAVTRQAMQDLRAFEMLAALENKEYVMSLIDENLKEGITFACYPKDADYLLSLREKVDRAITERLAKAK